MTELDHILDTIDRSFRGEAWHGPSVSEVLAGVDAATAGKRLTPLGHSIWELALHLRATIDILLGRIAGRIGEVDDAAYWPALPASPDAAAWHATLDELATRHNELLEVLRNFNAARLDEPLFAGGSPAFNNFLGHAQHNAYHAGQIALINRPTAAGALATHWTGEDDQILADIAADRKKDQRQEPTD